MKKITVIIAILTCVVSALILNNDSADAETVNYHFSQNVYDTIYKEEPVVIDTAALIDARLDTIAFLIAHRETGGTFNPNAKSANGVYCGLLQMDSWWVNKANKYIGEKKYVHSDRFDPAKCVEIWKIHQYNRNKKISIEYSIYDVLEEAYMIHCGNNSGVKTRRQQNTINYYKSLYKKVIDGKIEFLYIKDIKISK